MRLPHRSIRRLIGRSVARSLRATSLGAVVMLAPFATASAQSPAAARPAASTAPLVYFRGPSSGATVDTSFVVAFGLKDYGVAPAGVKLANTGHFHILIDVEPGPTGSVIPADAAHRHYGGGQIETTLTLKPGRYTLRLVLADHEHKVIGPQFTSVPLTVNVQKR